MNYKKKYNEKDNLEKITGIVENIVYYNDNNGYTVCHVHIDEDLATVVGYMPTVCEGETVEITGKWGFHSEYGEQFQAEFYEKVMPTEADDIKKYLASGIIKGIRKATAEKIVDCFGEESLNIIANEPEKLTRINGVTMKRAMEMSKSYASQIGIREVVIFLQKFDISVSVAANVFKEYGIDGVDKIKENPYEIIKDVYGFTFKIADKIALGMNFESNSPKRIEAAIIYALFQASNDGNTYLPRDFLLWKVTELIQVDKEEVDVCVTNLLFTGSIMVDNIPETVIYLRHFYDSEVNVSHKLSILIKEEPIERGDYYIDKAEQYQGITLEQTQREAVLTALRENCMVITGGPGTGKTTIINTIIFVMDSLNMEIALCAPTGRAAKRMSDLCGKEAKTVHRLLECEFGMDDSTMRFARNTLNPLQADVIIVDEVSMVDINLMSSLLNAVKKSTRLILVGDSDQLPSVGAGNVLYDIIQSKKVPTIKLTEIFRQAKESMIVVNAHKVNSGEVPICNAKDKDFYMLERDSGEDIVDTIVELCSKRLPKTYGFDPIQNIQVITPMRKGYTGVNSLNERLQAALNPPDPRKHEKANGLVTFRVGDKIMQIRNNYDIEWTRTSDNGKGAGIFNGDVGYVTKINGATEELVVLYDDDKIVEYKFNQLEDLALAYAITVHKSQGSEFDAVVMSMFPTAPMLQNRKLFYTAITRAKKLVVLVGRNSVLRSFVSNTNEKQRYTGLCRFLKDETKQDNNYIENIDDMGSVDDIYNIENIDDINGIDVVDANIY